MNPAQFDEQLAARHLQFESDSKIPANCVQFRFTGNFEHKSVIWDAQLVTLAYYSQTVSSEGPATGSIRPFIDVGTVTPQGRHLHIGLNVAIIDDATIRKTIIMIRQYKLLRAGRYEFGEPYLSQETD